MSAEASDRGRRSRARGNRAEVQVVHYLRDAGFPDARRYLAGDGRQPGDIDAIPGLLIEVKDCADARWGTWMAKATKEADRLDRAWVVVLRTRGVPKVALWSCRWSYSHDGVRRVGASTFGAFLDLFLRDEAAS